MSTNVFGVNTSLQRREVIESLQLSETALSFIYHITKALMGELVEEDKTAALNAVTSRVHYVLKAIKKAEYYKTEAGAMANLDIQEVRNAISILALRINLCKERLTNFKSENLTDFSKFMGTANPENQIVCGYSIAEEDCFYYQKGYFRYNNSTLVAMQKLHDEMLYSLIQVDYISL